MTWKVEVDSYRAWTGKTVITLVMADGRRHMLNIDEAKLLLKDLEAELGDAPPDKEDDTPECNCGTCLRPPYTCIRKD